MKRKIDTIKGKRLVMGGGTNTLTKNEILVTETPDGIELKERDSDGKVKQLSGSSGNSSSDMEYYSTSLEKVQTLGTVGDVIMGFISLVKFSFQQPSLNEMKLISGGGVFYTLISNNLDTFKLYGIGFTKINQNNDEYNSLKDFFSDLISKNGGDPNIFDTVFTPITKEEFYDLNNI